MERLNPFEVLTGSGRLARPWILVLLTGCTLGAAFAIARFGIPGLALLLAAPFSLAYLGLLFRFPVLGMYTAVALGFILIGLGRYFPGIPFGFGMDIILILTYIALFFNKFSEKIPWERANRDVSYLALIWFIYSVFQIFNPEARSLAAWVSGRGIGMYLFLLVPLTFLLIDDTRKLDRLLTIWGIFSILATLKGLVQYFYGPDFWEKVWLDQGNAGTHILFGQLRSFGFLSDAGQFGGNQAYSAVVAFVVALAQTSWKKRLFFILVAVLGIFGMVLSGTRGSLSVPLAGLAAFFVLRKNVTVLITGFLVLASIFVFFKFTSIGQGNQHIRRMRTAFDPNEPSLQVRLENQKKLQGYLATRPFGGGIGHGGVKAQKYLPKAYLSQIPTDSWYVLVWVEQGIVGLILHLFILMYILVKASFKIMFRIRDPILRLKLTGLTAGMFGIMVCSYGNAVLGQMPTSILIYISMALILNSDRFDRPPQVETAHA